MHIYRRIALLFVVITGVTLFAIMYASFVRAVIRLTPKEQAVTSSFLVEISKNPVGEEEVRGTLVSASLQTSERFVLGKEGGETKAVPGKASGILTIYNNRSSEQTLVKTTRFLSESGVLFRLDAIATVPAKGTAEARVTADQEGEVGNVAAGTFTIPGLSESLQNVVFGKSASAMEGGVRYVHVLSEEDVDGFERTLKEKAVESAKASLREQVSLYEGESYNVEVTDKKIEPIVGTETDAVTLSLNGTVVGVFFDDAALYAQAERLLYQDLPKGLRPVRVDRSKLTLSIERADLEAQRATMKVELSGLAIPSAANEALALGLFAGKTPAEVVRYFEEHGLAKTVDIELRPFWLNRLPKSPGKIRMLIKEE